MALSLLRMVEPIEGKILSVIPEFDQDGSPYFILLVRIDGIDISTIGLEDLRSRIVSTVLTTRLKSANSR